MKFRVEISTESGNKQVIYLSTEPGGVRRVDINTLLTRNPFDFEEGRDNVSGVTMIGISGQLATMHFRVEHGSLIILNHGKYFSNTTTILDHSFKEIGRLGPEFKPLIEVNAVK